MALTDVLGKTYTVVQDVQLMTKERRAAITLRTFTDSTKAVELNNMTIQVEGQENGAEVLGVGVNNPPAEAKEKDAYVLGEKPAGAWSDYSPGDFVKYNGRTWDLIPDVFSVYLKNGPSYQMSDGESRSWGESLLYIGAEVFDEWFSPAAMDKQGANIIERSYSYLKSRPDFSSSKDA